MKKIKTFEDACKALKLNPKSLPDVSALPSKYQKSIEAHYKLIVITEALNEGWEPDWNNSDEWKYWPYFDMRSKPGFGFSYSLYDYWVTHTAVCSRLCFKSRDLAEYAGKKFKKLYKDYMTL